MHIKPYLIDQGVFPLVNGLFPYVASQFLPPAGSDSSAPMINPTFLFWKLQDQLILSSLLSSLSMDVLHLVVDCQTSSSVWRTLEQAFFCPSNSRIMQLHGLFQELCQGNDNITGYLQRAKSMFDELVVAG